MSHAVQVWTDHREFERAFGAALINDQYVKFFRERIERGTWRKIPKGLKDAFASPRDEGERALLDLIARGDADEIARLEMELFKQNTRVAHAERMLKKKTVEQTRDKALSDRLDATQRATTVQGRLADLRRKEPSEQDSRVHVGQYAPVMVVQEGRRTVVPMRYHCRLPGWTAFVERQHPDTYQARRRDLQKSWSKLFGYRHGVMVVTRFYQTPAKPGDSRVPEPTAEQDEDVLLEFNPNPPRAMLVPCLWNFSPPSTPEERDIFSVAAIADESPPEVAATGHAHCITSIRRENLDAWLNPDPNNLVALHAILDDRETAGPFDVRACPPLRPRHANLGMA